MGAVRRRSHLEFLVKTTNIIVNAEQTTWSEKEISYDQVTLVAFPNPPPGVVITYTVEYERAEGNKDGSLVQGGQPVKVKDGMIFTVTETGRS
jgi:hypothetical protein